MNTELKTQDFYYDLPEELIAQTPLEKRSESRLMVLKRDDKKINSCIPDNCFSTKYIYIRICWG